MHFCGPYRLVSMSRTLYRPIAFDSGATDKPIILLDLNAGTSAVLAADYLAEVKEQLLRPTETDDATSVS